ncbi:6-bladed beta-propeller [Parabacteroides sp. PF5-6]|uniref:6-bladed beta-propeller n=1 Tax=Parabacteroides sp. PF5-6 TaxID=1742403 RepID=UPI0024063EED|nr:6-bladed beta-propeller [Parabacteroides sp. PF5-6]MDF9830325.1 hypothetical protein [Parabacteroides sp. PF5-6]
MNIKQICDCWILISIFCLSGCRTENTKENLLIGSLTEMVPKNLQASNLFDGVTFTALETTDSCLIGNIDQIKKRNNCFYVQADRRDLLVFDHKGSFVRRIGQIGHGPGEYAILSDFEVDEKNIYLMGLKKIYVYTLAGDFEHEIPLTINARSLRFAGENILTFVLGEKGENVVCVIDRKGHVREGVLKMNETLRLARPLPLVNWGDHKLLFHQGYSNDLLMYDAQSGQFMPMRILDHHRAMSIQENEKMEREGREINKYPGFIFDGLSSSATLLAFGCVENGEKVRLYVADEAKRTYISFPLDRLIDDVTFTSGFFLNYFMLCNSSEERFISYIEPYVLEEALSSTAAKADSEFYPLLWEIIDSIKSEESNPIIVEFKFNM